MTNIPLPNLPGSPNINNKHYLAINPSDNNLCVAFGIPKNIDRPTPGSVEGTIRCFNGYDAKSINDTIVYAQGIRNSVGFEFHPERANELWFTDCAPEIGHLLNEIPDDELNNVTMTSQHFGFPYCHTHGFGAIDRRNPGQRANFVDTVFGKDINDTCYEEEYFPAYQPLGPRVAALGMKFIFTEMQGRPSIPSKFILIAQHGTTEWTQLMGFRVMMVEFSGNGFSNIFDYKPFAEGWLDEEKQKYYGRPVDVEWLKLPGGSINDNGFIVSDDYAHMIYRIYYDPQDVVE